MSDISPDELAVTEWLKLRLAHHHARSGVNTLSIHATLYHQSGEIDTQWCLHANGECVVGQPSIAEGVRALKEKLAERAVTEVRA